MTDGARHLVPSQSAGRRVRPAARNQVMTTMDEWMNGT